MDAEAFEKAAKRPVIVILDNVRSAHNVGSVFRTADSFAMAEVWLCGIAGKPPHRDITKTALGAEETVPWRYFGSTEEALEALPEGSRLIAVEQAEGSISLDAFQPEPGINYAVVFGHEVRGVSDAVMARADQAIEIPQDGTKHSLNISVAAGIVLWRFRALPPR